jgi:ABC-type hemin transport system substrate-binding protein
MRLGTLGAALLLCVLVGCERKPVAPVAAGPRVVVHSPAVGVIVRDLKQESLVVGRHGHDMVLIRALPVVGTQEGFDYEALLAARPTHIITQWGSRELPARLVELSASQGWKVLDTRLLSLDDIRRDTVAVDAFLCAARGESAPSAEGRRLGAEMDRAWSRREDGFEKLGRVLLLASVNPPAAFGPGSSHHEVLVRIGATPAITTGSAFIELDAERIMALAPEVVVLVSPRGYGAAALTADEKAARVREKLAVVAGLPVPAARSGRLGIVDEPLALLPSTSMIGFADELAGVLEGFSRE